MILTDITPIILTFNEEANIERTLAGLSWAREIVVVDSGSSDRTVPILRADPRVRVVQRIFDSHAEQWNFALLQTGVRTPWVLALDADYVLSDDIARELAALEPPAAVAGYRARFRYVLRGRRLWGSLYPPAVVLFRREAGKYAQDGHTQRVELAGDVEELRNVIDHDDRKPWSRWLEAQHRYAELEARKLRQSRWSDLSWSDRARVLIVVAPALTLGYCLLFRGGLLQGMAGLQYALQRTTAEVILARTLIRRRRSVR